jgi:SAM-dependent methyltransferase
MTKVTSAKIFEVGSGFMAAKHLFVANELGLFKKLAEGPATLDELTKHIGVPQRTARIVADAMVALGFLERLGDRYQNAAVADEFLSGQHATDLCALLPFFNQILYPTWMKLEEAVRTGKTPSHKFEFTEADQRVYSEGVEAFSAEQAQALAINYDFGKHCSVLDLGGGTGSFLVAVLSQHSALQGTLLELPGAAAVAQQRLANHPLAGRIRFVQGDFFKVAIPSGHDAIIVANVIHVLSPERNLELLRRIREAVVDGSRLLLVDLWTDPTHTEPVFAALMAGSFLLRTGEGDVYSEEEARGWLLETGWQFLERKQLAGAASVIVAETAERNAAPHPVI